MFRILATHRSAWRERFVAIAREVESAPGAAAREPRRRPRLDLFAAQPRIRAGSGRPL